MNVDTIRTLNLIGGADLVSRAQGQSPARVGEEGSVNDLNDTDADSSTPSSATLQSYLAAARSLPSTRGDRVAALRSAIEGGTYQVPVEALARRLTGGSS